MCLHQNHRLDGWKWTCMWHGMQEKENICTWHMMSEILVCMHMIRRTDRAQHTVYYTSINAVTDTVNTRAKTNSAVVNDRENEDWRTYLREKEKKTGDEWLHNDEFISFGGKQMNGIEQHRKTRTTKLKMQWNNTKPCFYPLCSCAFFFKYFSFKIAACISFRRLSCLRLGDAQTRGEWPMACTIK